MVRDSVLRPPARAGLRLGTLRPPRAALLEVQGLPLHKVAGAAVPARLAARPFPVLASPSFFLTPPNALFRSAAKKRVRPSLLPVGRLRDTRLVERRAPFGDDAEVTGRLRARASL